MSNNIEPTTFVNATSVSARDAEYTGTPFTTGGMNNGGCQPGVGINIGIAAAIAVSGTTDEFTLLDQAAVARTPQDGQYIGGNGLGNGVAGVGTVPIIAVANDADGDGGVTDIGDATLVDLDGWTSV